jgi:hypothetical protein
LISHCQISYILLCIMDIFPNFIHLNILKVDECYDCLSKLQQAVSLVIIFLYPCCTSLNRNLLGHLLLSCEEWKETHVASRCCVTEAPNCASKQGLKSGCEILGAGAVACYAIGNKDPKFSYPACGYQCLNGPGAVQELQKYSNCSVSFL